jgi:mannosyltransferase OCH1-like enzyme
MNVATLSKKFEKMEAKSIVVIGKFILLLGLSGHLLFSVATWSATTDKWLDLISASEDFGVTSGGSNPTTIHLASNLSFSTANFTVANPSLHLPIYANQPTGFSTDNEFHDLRAPLFSDRIPLVDLVQTGPEPECHSTSKFKMSIFNSIIVDDEAITHPPQRKIPKIIHMTSKSRCITSRIKANILKWKLPEYSIYFHDDAAVDRLLSKYFPGFPHLQNVNQCSISGAGKADIWRYLVLWEYGGVYTGK